MDFHIRLMVNKKRFLTTIALAFTIICLTPVSESSACSPQGKLGRARANTNSKPKAQPKPARKKESKPKKEKQDRDRDDNHSKPSNRSSDVGKLFAVSTAVRDHQESKHNHESNDHRDHDRHDHEWDRRGRNRHNRNRDRGSRHGHNRQRSNNWFSGFSTFRSAPTFFAVHSQPPVTQTVIEHHEYYPAPAYPTPVPAPAIENVYATPPLEEVGRDLFVQEPVSAQTPIGISQFDWFHDWLAQLDVNVGSDFDGLDNAGFGFRFQVPESLGMDTDVSFFRESTGTVRDHMWLGDWNLLYEPIVSNNFRLRVGAGFNWLSDSWGSEYGFNLTSSINCRLTKNWMLQAEGDVGQIGDADYSHGKIQLVRSLGRSALALGYESYDIGGAKINGAFSGLQFRF